MKKIKMALIGAGTWGKAHAEIFSEHSMTEISAICDADIEKAEKAAAEFNIPKVYTNYKKMLAETGCDAVSIVTPDHLHGDIAVASAEAGKHLLIEKPLAVTREDVFRIVRAVKKNNVRAMVDLHNRWNPPFAYTKAAAEKGELGELRTAYIRLNDIKWVATDLLPWAAKSSILWFLGSHSLDTLNWIFNSRVKRVYSVSSRGVMDKLNIETIDAYLTTLEYENGCIAQMENSWISPNGNPNVNDFKFNVLGSKGMISVDASNHNLIQQYNETCTIVPDVLVRNKVHGKVKGFAYESIRSFVERLVSGEDFVVSLESAAQVSIVILAIMESAEKHKPIEVDYSGLAEI